MNVKLFYSRSLDVNDNSQYLEAMEISIIENGIKYRTRIIDQNLLEAFIDRKVSCFLRKYESNKLLFINFTNLISGKINLYKLTQSDDLARNSELH